MPGFLTFNSVACILTGNAGLRLFAVSAGSRAAAIIIGCSDALVACLAGRRGQTENFT